MAACLRSMTVEQLETLAWVAARTLLRLEISASQDVPLSGQRVQDAGSPRCSAAPPLPLGPQLPQLAHLGGRIDMLSFIITIINCNYLLLIIDIICSFLGLSHENGDGKILYQGSQDKHASVLTT